jgi:GT2 family glycosyltransferase
MRDVDVAVVVVSYKSAGLAIDCLRSIERERSDRHLSLGCVVVDNASGDAAAIAAEVEAQGWGGWAEVLVAERNGGFAYGNNLGIGAALRRWNARYLHLLNPDTVLRPGAIDALTGFLDAHPQVGVAGGIFENADESIWSVAFQFPCALGEFAQGLEVRWFERLFRRSEVVLHLGFEAVPVDWVSGASMMVRRSVIDEIGGLDEGFFLYFEETEFCYRVKLAGHQVWYVPQSRVMHIAGQSTKVNERSTAPKRLPAYWFDSRRRYFVLTHGTAYASLADLLAAVGCVLGSLKRRLQGRPSTRAPGYVRDLLGKSIVWPSNRKAEPGRRVVPRF